MFKITVHELPVGAVGEIEAYERTVAGIDGHDPPFSEQLLVRVVLSEWLEFVRAAQVVFVRFLLPMDLAVHPSTLKQLLANFARVPERHGTAKCPWVSKEVDALAPAVVLLARPLGKSHSVIHQGDRLGHCLAMTSKLEISVVHTTAP